MILDRIPDELKTKIKEYYPDDIDRVKIVLTKHKEDSELRNKDKTCNGLLNLERINNVRRINKFHNHINDLLDYNEYYISCAETLGQRHIRNNQKMFFGFKKIYSSIDFIYKRILPKIPLINKIYFIITKGHNRVMSKAEILGRLFSCGFEVKEYFQFNNLLYIISKKKSKPSYDMNPSFHPIFKMKRIGKNNKNIYVYKFRTMHPYSEYLQDFILRDNGYDDNGKIKNDYRVTFWGKIFRKYWLDEIPQLINWLKGDMKLVGVRPLSERFLNEYPEDIKQKRLKLKPGCIPPYVALKMQSVSDYIESERIYINAKEKHPYTTDIRFFFKAIYNIVCFSKIIGDIY